MKESIHKYFQIGTIQWMSYPFTDPMESLLEIARDDYFDAIEMDRSVLVSIINGDTIDIPLEVMDRICTAVGSRMQDFFMCIYFENLER